MFRNTRLDQPRMTMSSRAPITHTSNLCHVFDEVVALRTHIFENVATFHIKHITLVQLFKQLCNEQQKMSDTLDMFNVQIHTIMLDIQHIERLEKYIFDHSYCQYYRTYTTLYDFIDALFTPNQPTMYHFPKYDYMCPTKTYDFGLIQKVREGICELLDHLYNHITSDTAICNNYNKINNVGIRIDPLVNTLACSVNTVADTYVATFDNVAFYDKNLLHYLKRLIYLVKYLATYINDDINMDALTSMMR